MGGRGRGGKRGRTQRRDFKDGRPNVWKKPRPEGEAPSGERGGERGWQPFITESKAYENYYKKQGVVPPEEWDLFIETLRTPLPTCFRINGSGQFAQDIGNQMQHDFFDYLKEGVEVDGKMLEPIKPLEWYPGKLAWTLSFSRMQLRKMPILERIHEFLKQENEIGSITRQEAVSMLPPLFLDVQPHHRVLDMCAAPGSKTFQLLEMIHKDDKPECPTEGLIVANDLDVQRCHLLIHQTKRMCSPNILVTNHEAQHFPGLRKKGRDFTTHVNNSDEVNSSLDDSRLVEGVADGEMGLLFDRILCDVPCSGDGTIRKAPDIWKKWHCGLGNGIHTLQIQIAMRGVALLKVGGRLVYSTCSLNPVEDEAVVGEMLRQAGGSLELLDVSGELPGLKCRPGLKSWLVRDKRRWIVSASQVDRHRAGVIVPSMFPSGKGWDLFGEPESTEAAAGEVEEEGSIYAEKIKEKEDEIEDEVEEEPEVASLPLERCMRILPHDQNSGGFFIAVFRKVAPFKVHPKIKDLKNERRQKEKLKVSAGKLAKDSDMTPEGSESKTGAEEVTAMVLDNSPVTLDATEESSSAAKEGETTLAVGEVLEEDVGVAEDEVPNGSDGKAPERNGDKKLQQQGRWKGVDPVLFLEDEQVIESLISYYGLKDSFPMRGRLVTRSEDTARLKRIYYVSNSVSDALKLNLRAGQHLKITSAGLKIFERQAPRETADLCAFRIASEGLPVMLPHMTKQIVHTTRADFKLLLSGKAVPFFAFKEPDFVNALQSLLPGCCVVVLPERNENGDVDLYRSTAVGCWRGRSNVSLLITKAEAGQMLQRLFVGDDELKSEEPVAASATLEKEAEEKVEPVGVPTESEGTVEPAGITNEVEEKVQLAGATKESDEREV